MTTIILAEWEVLGERYRAVQPRGRVGVEAELWTVDPESGIEGWRAVATNLSSSDEAMRVVGITVGLYWQPCHPRAEPCAAVPYLGVVR